MIRCVHGLYVQNNKFEYEYVDESNSKYEERERER